MQKKISKELILKTCLQKQEELIKNYDSRVMEMQTDTTNDDDDPSASQSEDHNAGDVEIMSTMAGGLEFAQREMVTLAAIDPAHVNEMVEPGAVVVTNNRTFFIAVSSERVEVGEEVIYGISTNAPIYTVMAGLKKGETFKFNGTGYKIEDIY
jgi:hypothetical protein